MQQTATPIGTTRSSSPRGFTPVHGLHLWHLLSLDAPTVAVLWMWFVAATTGTRLPISSLSAMFLAVWMLYAADRLLDARQLSADPLRTDELEPRHLFHHLHSKAFMVGILLASPMLAVFVHQLLPSALELFAILGAILFGWFMVIHVRAAPWSDVNRRLPKELAVGIFFPAAIFIPTVARHPELRLALLPHALLFAAVCSLNCLAIYAWEHPEPRIAAHWTTRFATRHFTSLGVAIGVAGVFLAILTRETFWALAVATSLSASALLVLDRRQRSFSPLTLRTAADLALLTPLLLLPWLPGAR